MRLLVDAHVFDGKFQGTLTYLMGIYQHMVEHKDIDFYFASQDIERIREIFGCAANVHYVKLSSTGSIRRLALEFPKIIKKYDIDIAHYQYISPLQKCCKEIVTVHDLLFLDFPQYFPMFYRLKNRVLFKKSAKRADFLLTVSDYSRKSISKHFDIPSENIYVTPNAVLPLGSTIVLPDVKAKFGLDKYILTVSRIEPRKNHLMLLKAFIDLHLMSKGYKLVMVGVNDLFYEEFADYYNKLSLKEKNSIIMQPASFPELIGLYQQASLFVFPSFAEGFGIPPLEAIEFGCPVLCSNTTAMAEFKFPKEWTFNPHDENELKEKMLKLLEKRPDITSEQKRLRMEFNWDKIANYFYEIICHGTK